MTEPPAKKSKNSETATRGNRAEDLICSQPNVKAAFESYFGKSVTAILKVPGRKKSDNELVFTDGSRIMIQNKNGDNARGFSVDRRDVCDLTSDVNCRNLISRLCLKKELGLGTASAVDKEESERIITVALLGSENDFKPLYFCHTIIKDDTITNLSICPTASFIDYMKKEIYPTMVSKKTCVHLSPSFYLQRKGGGKTDAKPDHIQTKWKQGKTVSTLFSHLFTS